MTKGNEGRRRRGKGKSMNKISSLEISEQERQRRQIKACGNERGRQEDGRECGWEREGVRGDTNRQTEGKREWSMLEP